MNNEKILLVDDEEEFVEALSERMTLREISVVTAPNGTEAIRLVGKESFDCVILDMMMPELDGIETLTEMLKIDKDLQVIMLTGHATVQKGVEAIKLGAMDFLEKPADIEKLVQLIKEAKMKRLMLVEKQTQAMVEDIMKRKGW
ncbi:MAG: response regulator [bacterium]